MNWMILGGIAGAAVLLLAVRAWSGRGGKSARIGYRKEDFLFSPEERLFYTALQQAVAEEYAIFGKIRASFLIAPRPGGHRAPSPEELEILSEHYFTFVLCHRSDLSVACAVQLQEHAPGGGKTPRQPEPLAPVCHLVGLPLVVFQASPWYDLNAVRETVAEAVRKEPLYIVESGGRKEPRISGFDNLDL